MDIQVLSGPPQLVKACSTPFSNGATRRRIKLQDFIANINFTLAKGGGIATPASPVPAALQPITRMHPVYPAEAKKAGIEGVVVLRATIEKDGSVSKLEVLSGDPQLRQSGPRGRSEMALPAEGQGCDHRRVHQLHPCGPQRPWPRQRWQRKWRRGGRRER